MYKRFSTNTIIIHVILCSIFDVLVISVYAKHEIFEELKT